ncbi:MAG: heavy metal translocating P-type ATPase [Gammaproteobacteria bacterium]
MPQAKPAVGPIEQADKPAQPLACFHCGLPVPAGLDIKVTIDGLPQPMCCYGCQAVAQAIVAAGHTGFYRHRTQPSPTGEVMLPEFIQQTEVYDHPEIQKTFVRSSSAHEHEAALILEGITCAACIWLNERHLSRLPGVLDVQINYATHRARIRWDDTLIKLSQLLQAIHHIGYTAHPYDPAQQQQARERERRAQLRRIGITGVLGMQVMVLSFALYMGDWTGIEEGFRNLFRWLGLLLTTPVLLYSGAPFLHGAWRDLKNKSVGMDVPVSLGILVAFGGSLHATLTGHGEVYFDSVVMFVLFLLVSRYFEMMARKRGAETAENLAQALPAMATRLGDDGDEARQKIIPAAELQPGDRVLIKPGAAVPADGTVESGSSGVSEALLSGESTPLLKTPGAKLIGGSINMDSALVMRVEKTGLDTVLAEITRLLERAQQDKPAITRLADRVAGIFVIGVLLLATAAGLYWWQHSPQNWLPILVSILVVTCPCALSLATPTAISAATGTLLSQGLLATGNARLEIIARVNCVVFDKTGTLTAGVPVLVNVQTDSSLDEATLLHIAAALETHSEHAAAHAIIERAGNTPFRAENIRNYPGAGISGEIDGKHWYIGNAAFVQAHCRTHGKLDTADHHTQIFLADREYVHALLFLHDEIRPDARATVEALQQAGRNVILMSGDNPGAARAVADQVGIDTVLADLSPADKLRELQTLQQLGNTVIMVGDGINDAPVLAAADVSVAMQGAAQISQASADMILLSNRLIGVSAGLHLAQRTLRIIRQNLAWAVTYNLIALPAATLGLVAPWMAAIGMSSSSLLVVLNALRLTRGGK